jgi:hypothetical protein
MIIPFIEEQGTTAFDPRYQPHNYAYWISSEGADMEWIENCWVENNDYAERIGSEPEPPCNAPSNPNEHICNGGFEQYHSILNNPPQNTNVIQPLQHTNGVSDVVGWKTVLATPDFFVRNGIGGIPVPSSLFGATANTHDYPQPGNNAFAGMYSQYLVIGGYPSINYQEEIRTNY